MDNRNLLIVILLIGGAVAYYTRDQWMPKEDPCPGGVCPTPVKPPPTKPAPKPRCPNCPREGEDGTIIGDTWIKVYKTRAEAEAAAKLEARRYPLRSVIVEIVEIDTPEGTRFYLRILSKRADEVGAKEGGRDAPDGTPIQCDLPDKEHMKNVGGSDGAGLCVFTSCEHSARYQNIPALVGFQDWMRRHPGGGWPQKLEQMIERFCKEQGVEVPPYFQVEGKDTLEVLKLACKTGRMPCVTYSFSPSGRYGGQRIAHMVNIAHCDDFYVAVLDNNYPGENKYEWLTVDEFLKTYTGWCVIFLNPAPPPPPRNTRA